MSVKRQTVRKIQRLVFLGILTLSLTTWANTGITYHGRIMRANDTPVNSALTQFRIQIRTPGTENCLLWEEQQTHDLSTTNGVFSVTIADMSAPSSVANILPYSLEKVFSNRANFTGLTNCSVGTSYNPSTADGRKLQVFFRENNGDPWEQMPTTKVNFVPMALNSVQLEGYQANEFLKIDPLAVYTPLTAANVTTLLDIIAGTNAQYLKPNSAFSGDVTGNSGATVVEKIRGTNVVATVPTLNQVLKFDGTNWVPSADATGGAAGDATYVAKGIVQIDTNLATSGLSITTGVLSLPNVVTAGGPTGNAQTVPIITYDAKGRLTTVSSATINDNTKLPLAGGTMSGSIDMGTGSITNATNVTASNVSATNLSGRSLILNDNDNSNTATVRSPVDITASYILTLPAVGPAAGQILSSDALGNLSWIASSSGSVTGITSTNLYLSVDSSAPATPALTLNVGTAANTVAAGNDSRITGALQTSAYNADLLPAASCTSVQKPSWNTVSDAWECLAIGTVANATSAVNFSGSLAGDVSGTQGATSVDKIKGIAVSAATANNQIMIYDGTNWVNNIFSGDATLANSGALTLASTVTAGGVGSASAVPTINYDAKGRITSTSSAAYQDATAAVKGVVSVGTNLTVTSGAISLSNANVLAAIGFTPVNKAGDTMSGTFGLFQTAADPDSTGWNATQKGYSWFNTTSNSVKYWDGSAVQALGVSGAGLTSLGGQAGSTQTFANAATGTAPAFSSAVNVHTLNIPLASGAGVTSGTIAKADYDSFVAKLTSPLTTKGDLLTRDATTHVRLPAGTNGQVLSANSAQASGLEWITATTGTVTNVSSANPYITVATGGTTPVITAVVGTAANTLAAGDDSRILGSVQITAYNADLLPAASCTSVQKPSWNTVSDAWECIAIASLDAAAITSGVLVPARLGTGTADSSTYLRGDGSWAAAGLPGNAIVTYQVRVATTANITLSGVQTIDSVAVVAGDRVLVKNQTAPAQNGIYVVTAGSWVRATDMATWTNTIGYTAQVSEGTGWAGMTFSSESTVGGTIGTTALNWNSKGSSGLGNTANGYIALRSNTIGTNNTANGNNALYSNTSGDRNTANGYNTLRSNTSGYDNTANGSNALYLNSTGYNNTANGTQVLYTNTIGYNNTANGIQSLYTNTSGHSNTTNGVRSLYSNTTGTNNTAIGINALYQNTTGYQNTTIGHNSGSAITTGFNNVVIGSNTGSTFSTSSNNISISDGAGTERIRVLASGNVGIGTAAPGSLLDINGAATQRGITAATAGLSPAGQGRMYFDSTSNTFKISQNGGAYADILTSASGGITSLGGLTAGTQTFANGATGTAPAFVSATSTHTLNIPLASTASVTSGTISNTDYTSFVAKLTSPLTTKGDLLTRDATTHVRLAVGTDGQVLSASSADAGGLAWVTPTTGDITDVIAGAGLTGGAASGSATVDVFAGTGIVVNANDVAVDVGTTVGKIVQVQIGGKLPVLDGSDLTNLDAGDIATGTLPIARGGTGQVTANAALNAFLPTQATHSGKVLSTNGTDTSWIAAATGTVTNVSSANAYITVATGGTTPVLTVVVGTAANTLAAGDDSRIVGAMQLTNYNTQVAPAASCTGLQTPYYNSVSSLWACQNISATHLNTVDTIVKRDTAGSFAATDIALSGSLRSEKQVSANHFSAALDAVDWNNGNVQTTSSNCQALAFTNMQNGGSYTLIVTDVATAGCLFPASINGGTAVTWRGQPTLTSHTRTATSHTVYTMLRAGSVIYVSWITGF